jgi:AAA+ ATPase superfamily predicted ATPase
MANDFPTTLALGRAFCNRREELKRLTTNLKRINPTLIMSPRRYGKTSLAINSFQYLKWPYTHIDFYTDLTEDGIERAILNGIGYLLGQLETVPKRLLHLASDFFGKMQINVVFEKAGFKLDFSRKQRSSPQIILEALEKLHDLAEKKKKKVILFLDEFQVLAEVMQNYSIEGAIRHAVQKSQYVAYVFSGSNRHLISSMFYDKNRPFYKSCDVIKLERISQQDYEPYIQRSAKKRWGKTLNISVLEKIFLLTEYHPYYVNKLCSLLWLIDEVPKESDVLKQWKQYALENKSLIEREIELISLNQRKLLIAIAKNEPTKEIFGKQFSVQIDISSGSLSRTLDGLMEKDYIHIDEHRFYRVLDPLIRFILSGAWNLE